MTVQAGFVPKPSLWSLCPSVQSQAPARSSFLLHVPSLSSPIPNCVLHTGPDRELMLMSAWHIQHMMCRVSLEQTGTSRHGPHLQDRAFLAGFRRCSGMIWSFHPVTTLVLLGAVILYSAGYRKAHAVHCNLCWRHVTAFTLGMLCLALATLSPLAALKMQFLFARSLQQVLVSILAPPLLWYSHAPVCIGYGLPDTWRQKLRRTGQTAPVYLAIVKRITSPGIVWPGTLVIFALWHEHTIVNGLMSSVWLSNAGLWLYFSAFLLFWWHAMAAPPRLHPALPIWLRFLFLIVGGEIANMVAGVSLAFRSQPLFAHYASQTHDHALSALQDQMISGGIIWITGSFVYVLFAVSLLGQAVFTRALQPGVPARDWQTASLQTIAPGLEQRVKQ